MGAKGIGLTVGRRNLDLGVIWYFLRSILFSRYSNEEWHVNAQVRISWSNYSALMRLWLQPHWWSNGGVIIRWRYWEVVETEKWSLHGVRRLIGHALGRCVLRRVRQLIRHGLGRCVLSDPHSCFLCFLLLSSTFPFSHEELPHHRTRNSGTIDRDLKFPSQWTKTNFSSLKLISLR